jgi:GTP-binding protein Era
MTHKSGFVNIIGHPNIGKSTLLNALMGEKFSIITSKPQTTRHRIHAIYNDDNHQIVFSDTPGIIEDPRYKMHESMNKFAQSSFKDADIMLFMTDIYDEYEADNKTISRLKTAKCIKFLVINKIDLGEQEQLNKLAEEWKNKIEFDEIFLISAKEKHGTSELLEAIKGKLEEGPEYYPKDQTSDRSMRFFIEERIREKILQQYKKEIPYSVEILVETYKESTKRGKPFVEIRAVIYVARKTQKSILIGKEGAAIKKLGIASRRDIEKFIGNQIMLELFVKVKEGWRNNDNLLKQFGYQNK